MTTLTWIASPIADFADQLAPIATLGRLVQYENGIAKGLDC